MSPIKPSRFFVNDDQPLNQHQQVVFNKWLPENEDHELPETSAQCLAKDKQLMMNKAVEEVAIKHTFKKLLHELPETSAQCLAKDKQLMMNKAVEEVAIKHTFKKLLHSDSSGSDSEVNSDVENIRLSRTSPNVTSEFYNRVRQSSSLSICQLNNTDQYDIAHVTPLKTIHESRDTFDETVTSVPDQSLNQTDQFANVSVSSEFKAYVQDFVAQLANESTDQEDSVLHEVVESADHSGALQNPCFENAIFMTADEEISQALAKAEQSLILNGQTAFESVSPELQEFFKDCVPYMLSENINTIEISDNLLNEKILENNEDPLLALQNTSLERDTNAFDVSNLSKLHNEIFMTVEEEQSYNDFKNREEISQIVAQGKLDPNDQSVYNCVSSGAQVFLQNFAVDLLNEYSNNYERSKVNLLDEVILEETEEQLLAVQNDSLENAASDTMNLSKEENQLLMTIEEQRSYRDFKIEEEISRANMLVASTPKVGSLNMVDLVDLLEISSDDSILQPVEDVNKSTFLARLNSLDYDKESPSLPINREIYKVDPKQVSHAILLEAPEIEKVVESQQLPTQLVFPVEELNLDQTGQVEEKPCEKMWGYTSKTDFSGYNVLNDALEVNQRAAQFEIDMKELEMDLLVGSEESVQPQINNAPVPDLTNILPWNSFSLTAGNSAADYLMHDQDISDNLENSYNLQFTSDNMDVDNGIACSTPHSPRLNNIQYSNYSNQLSFFDEPMDCTPENMSPTDEMMQMMNEEESDDMDCSTSLQFSNSDDSGNGHHSLLRPSSLSSSMTSANFGQGMQSNPNVTIRKWFKPISPRLVLSKGPSSTQLTKPVKRQRDFITENINNVSGKNTKKQRLTPTSDDEEMEDVQERTMVVLDHVKQGLGHVFVNQGAVNQLMDSKMQKVFQSLNDVGGIINEIEMDRGNARQEMVQQNAIINGLIIDLTEDDD